MTTSTGRSTDSRRSGRSVGQWLLGLLIVLALVASVLMIFTDQLSLTGSIAVLAALWAAVIGAILVTKFRRQAESAEAKSRDLRLVYELQLEREISARRQYELDVEATIRKEVNEESNAELAELKKQVLALRSSLEMLLGESLPDTRAALPNEKLRELASGLGGSGGSLGGYDNRGYGTSGFYPQTDDSVLAARDFAATAPAAGARRASDGVDPGDIDPNEMTEIIPIIRDEEPISGRIATEVPFTPQPGPDDTVDVEEVAPESVVAESIVSETVGVEPVPAPTTDQEPTPQVDDAPVEGVADEAPAQSAATSGTAETTAAGLGPDANRPHFVDDAPTDSWEPQDREPQDRAQEDRAQEDRAQEDRAQEGRAQPIPATAGRHEGGHAFNGTSHDESPAPVGGRRHRREVDESDSAHSAGLPVSELLSQLRQSGAPGGGRRRRED